ncbi:MAG: efflux RND transporter permease subunit [Clostridia bacterium]|nr:efflux RND transporter permease subunit [Clostridia bacterium]
MRAIVAWSLRQRLALSLGAALVLAGGALALAGMRQEEMPDIDIPYVVVTTAYPGATAEDVARELGRPMEEALRGLPGLKSLYSTSVADFLALTLEFDLDTRSADDVAHVRDALSRVALPDGAGEPQVTAISFGSAPVLEVSLTAPPGLSEAEFQDRVRQTVLPSLRGTPGVGRVDALGLGEPSVEVELDPAALGAHGLTADDVVRYLEATNLAFPAGAVADAEGAELGVRVEGRVDSLDALRALPIPYRPASPPPGGLAASAGALAAPTVPLGELATVRTSSPEPAIRVRQDGRPAVELDVVREPGAATTEVADRALSALSRAARQAGLGYTVLYDAADTVRASLAGMEREVGLGALFAALVIFAFLGRWRATLVAALAIPVSLALGALALARLGVSLNIMTLGGMAVAAGRVVDDAIVVVENVHRRMRSEGASARAIVEGASEVGLAITASTLTTVAVFVPLGLVGGLVGRVFEPFAWTVVFALLASLVVAVTLVPALTSALYGLAGGSPSEAGGEAGPSAGAAAELPRWQLGYRRVLGWFLDRKWATLGLALILLAFAGWLGGRLGTSFLPADAIDLVVVEATFPPDTSEDRIDRLARAAEEEILATDGVRGVETVVGASRGLPMTTELSAPNRVEFTVRVAERGAAPELAARLGRRLPPVLAPARVSARPFSTITGSDSILLVLDGADEATLAQAARKVEAKLAAIPGLGDVTDTVRAEARTVEVRVDPQRAAAHGLTTAQVLAALRARLAGTEVGTLSIAGEEIPVTVRSGPKPDLASLGALPLPGALPARLEDVAEVETVVAPLAVNRRNLAPYVAVQADVVASDVGAVTAAVARAVREADLPPGVEARDVGVTETIADGFRQMGRAIAVAIGVVFLVMLVAFGDAFTPIAILVSLPFAAVGALLALDLAGLTLSIPALIGLLMLVGIVVTNAIVLMDRCRRQVRRGVPLREALLEAASVRLRPILMTALATMCALLPVALGLGEGSLVGSTLAWVVVGGLFSSTVLTLVVVPAAYEALVRAFGGRV